MANKLRLNLKMIYVRLKKRKKY